MAYNVTCKYNDISVLELIALDIPQEIFDIWFRQTELGWNIVRFFRHHEFEYESESRDSRLVMGTFVLSGKCWAIILRFVVCKFLTKSLKWTKFQNFAMQQNLKKLTVSMLSRSLILYNSSAEKVLNNW